MVLTEMKDPEIVHLLAKWACSNKWNALFLKGNILGTGLSGSFPKIPSRPPTPS